MRQVRGRRLDKRLGIMTIQGYSTLAMPDGNLAIMKPINQIDHELYAKLTTCSKNTSMSLLRLA